MAKFIIALIIVVASFILTYFVGSALYSRQKVGLAYLCMAVILVAGIAAGILIADYFGIDSWLQSIISKT